MPQIQLNAHRFPNPILEIKECFIKQEILEINDDENAGQENVSVDKTFFQFKPNEEVIEEVVDDAAEDLVSLKELLNPEEALSDEDITSSNEENDNRGIIDLTDGYDRSVSSRQPSLVTKKDIYTAALIPIPYVAFPRMVLFYKCTVCPRMEEHVFEKMMTLAEHRETRDHRLGLWILEYV